MTIKEYTREFYRLDIRSKCMDDEVDKVSRYLNCLKSKIKD